MPLYEMTPHTLDALAPTTFAEAGFRERDDLQRLLRDRIGAIAPGTLVIAEEFGQFEASKRRIDLLGVDTDGTIVVIELKRTVDGGHMELQALRYAAMVSQMTLEQAAEYYGDYLRKHGDSRDPREAIDQHLANANVPEAAFGKRVRIVLASADFDKELTTAVLWLNDQGLDITCMRLSPYCFNEHILLDIQQIIPLPEAKDHQVRVREKNTSERKATNEVGELCREFFSQLLRRSSEQGFSLFRTISPPAAGSMTVSAAPVKGARWVYAVRKDSVKLQLDFAGPDRELNLRHFKAIEAEQANIEEDLGSSLEWRCEAGSKQAQIEWTRDIGGWQSDRERWPEIQNRMIDAMKRFEQALRPHMTKLDDVSLPPPA